MKKVLVLSASPRRGGNSDMLCDEFIRGARETGAEVEKIFLKDKNINYCIGCGLCTRNNYTSCSQKDDAAEVLEKMVQADVIVMATPVYFYTLCAQMKTLIDRCCSRYPAMSNKDFYYIVTAADSREDALERTIECFRGFTDCLSGSNEKGILYAVGVWNVGDVKQTDLLNRAYKMGKTV